MPLARHGAVIRWTFPRRAGGRGSHSTALRSVETRDSSDTFGGSVCFSGRDGGRGVNDREALALDGPADTF